MQEEKIAISIKGLSRQVWCYLVQFCLQWYREPSSVQVLRQGSQQSTELRIRGEIFLRNVTQRERCDDWKGETKCCHDRVYPFKILFSYKRHTDVFCFILITTTTITKTFNKIISFQKHQLSPATLLTNAAGVAHSKRRYVSRFGGRRHFTNPFWFTILSRKVVNTLFSPFCSSNRVVLSRHKNSFPQLSCARVLRRILLAETHQSVGTTGAGS